MKEPLRTSFGLSFLLMGLVCAEGFALQTVNRPAQTASITGTYKYVLNTLQVLELPDHKARISFAGFYPNDRKRAETRNSGTFDEIVALEGKTATVRIQFGDDPCTITLKFRPNKVIVEQGGSIQGCGFGFNVEPDGTYVKTSSKLPSFPPP